MAPVQLPELSIPADLEPEHMPDLLRHWYLGSPARRHLMLRRFAEVDSELTDSGVRVLDIGSAWGFNVLVLLKLGYRAVGIDLVTDPFQVGIRIARANGLPFTIAGADAAALPFDGDAFDAITMVETFEHIYVDDRLAVLAECRRVLRRGGRLILSTPNERGPVERGKRWIGRRRWLRDRLPPMCYPDEGTARNDYHPYRYHSPLSEERIHALLASVGLRATATKHFLFSLKITPDRLQPMAAAAERALERIPGLRPLASTVCITAEKP